MTARNATEQKEFVISRTLDAPREPVWKMWTEPEHMNKWWSPKDYIPVKGTMDFRPGGSYHYHLRGPDGTDMWGKLVYREIVPPSRLVFVTSFSDEKGGIGRHPLSPTWPLEMLSTITFEETNGKTTVTVRWIPINATEEECRTFDEGRDGMKQGWTGTLDLLEEHLRKTAL
jgi:uncharacterized protein YndB with AHSA1/START domain